MMIKYLLIFFLTVNVFIVYAQSLRTSRSTFSPHAKKQTVRYDTIGSRKFSGPGSSVRERLDASEYLIQGESTTENYWFTDVEGSVVIQNSYRKGSPYTNPAGEKFGCAIFWTRVKNETDKPITMTIISPADSFAVESLNNPYVKIFLPSDTMNLGKTMLYNYGATGLTTFLDANWNKPSTLKRTIEPGGEHIFYIAAVHNGIEIRQTELVLKERNLYFSLRGTGTELDSRLIPCGEIVIER